MRLGAYPAELAARARRSREAYGEEVVYERHRHRYEFNNRYRARLEDAGLVLLGHVARRPAGRVHRARRATRSGSAPRPTPSSRAGPTGRTRCSASSCEAALDRAEGRAPRLPLDRSTRVPPSAGVTDRRAGFRVVGSRDARSTPASCRSSSVHVRGARRRRVRPRRRPPPGRGRRSSRSIDDGTVAAGAPVPRRHRPRAARDPGRQARRRRASRPRSPRAASWRRRSASRRPARAARPSSTTRPASATSTPTCSSPPTSRRATRAAVSVEEAAMTIEQVAARRRRRRSIAPGELVDAKSIIGLAPAPASPTCAGAVSRRRLGRRARRIARRVRDLADGRAGPGRRTRWPPTGATCAATPRTCGARGVTGDAATVDEAIVAGYVEELAAAPRRRRPAALRAVVGRARARRGAVVPPVLRRGGARCDADPSEEVGAPRVPAGHPEGADRGRGRGAARRGGRRRPASRCATGPSSRCSTAPGCASASWSGLDLGDLDLDDGLVRVFGKGGKERIVPLGRTARDALGDYLAARPPRARAPGRDASDAEAVFLNARGGRLTRQGAWLIVRARRRPGRPRRPPVPARAAPLVRHPHARPRRRHPGGAGAARPRQPLDHAGVHEGVAGAAAGRLRGRPPPGRGGPATPAGRGPAREGRQ